MRSGDTFVQTQRHDQRLFDPTTPSFAGPFRSLNRVRIGKSETAITALRTYAPSPGLGDIGLMFGLTGVRRENLAGILRMAFR